ncbi:MAG: hypothetical protein ACHQUC_04600 [Chlamydiales bacterium]
MSAIGNSRPPKPDGYCSDTEFSRQRETEQKFFRRRDNSSWKYEQYRAPMSDFMNKRRMGKIEQSTALLDPLPARMVVVAEKSVTEDVFNPKNPNPQGYFSPILKQQYKTDYYVRKKNFPSYWSPIEAVRLKTRDLSSFYSISYVQKANPHKNHKGDCRVDFKHDGSSEFISDHSVGSYGAIWETLNNLICQGQDQNPNDDDEPQNLSADVHKNMASLFLKYGRELYAISKTELATALKIPPKKVYETDVQFINDLCYLLFIKEITRRQSPADSSEHNLPFATSLIRALKLVQIGAIPLETILSPDAPYGAFTGSNLGKDEEIAKTEKKIRNVNRLFHTRFKTHLSAPSLQNPLLKTTDPLSLRKELADVYGGATDSDNDEYVPLPVAAAASGAVKKENSVHK